MEFCLFQISGFVHSNSMVSPPCDRPGTMIEAFSPPSAGAAGAAGAGAGVADMAAKGSVAAAGAAGAGAAAGVAPKGSIIAAGAAAKNALDERYDGYQFGDISKEAAGAAKSGIEAAMRKATGNEDYQFGDVTKNLAKGFLGKISEAAGAAKERLEDDDKKE